MGRKAESKESLKKETTEEQEKETREAQQRQSLCQSSFVHFQNSVLQFIRYLPVTLTGLERLLL